MNGLNADQNFSPPVLRLERNWRIRANEPVGTVVTRVQVADNRDEITYSLAKNDLFGSSVDDIPFRIDNKTGVVYVNSSLEINAGKNMMLYVIADNGGNLPAKSEVWINILNPNASSNFGNGPGKNFPFIPTPPQFSPNKSTLPSTIFNLPANRPRPPVSDTTVSPPSIESLNETSTISETTKTITTTLSTKLAVSTEVPAIKPIIPVTMAEEKQYPEKTAPVQSIENYYLTVAVIPIIVTICVLLLTVSILLLVFRNRICMGNIKNTKTDKKKESSVSIQLSDDPTITMQEWQGPRAFSNRYEPWERDTTQNNNSFQPSCPTTTETEKTDKWEYPRHRLKIFNILGEGAFGQVWRCEASDIGGSEGKITVAVKTLKENATEKERNDLVAELEVMKTLEPHPNVVRLLGCCSDKGPVLVIMEYVSRGKLQEFLRNSRAERCYGNMHGESKTLTSRDLTSFVYQIARGMEYISSKGIVHRDLAARNILITEDHTCKVADFGFARDVTTSRIYERKSEGGLPIRWMAPESLYDNVYTIKSDIWSFGILMWEIVTLGSTPYPGCAAADVMRKVRDGYRLDKPDHCRRELYNIMYYCWDKNPQERPTFAECVAIVEKLLLTETDYIELDRFPDHSYYNMPSLSGEKL